MKRILIIIVLLIMGCSKAPVTDFKFDTRAGVPVINVMINEKPGRLLIDTGANMSILDVSKKDHYGFDTYQLEEGIIVTEGIGGIVETGYVGNVIVRTKDSILPLRFKYLDISQLGAKMNIVGVIGSDYLIKHKLVVDYKTKTIHR